MNKEYKEYKEYKERKDAKAQLRIWLSDCVLDGAKMDKEETNELDKRER